MWLSGLRKSTLPENIEKFLDSGKPPVFTGFGSNPVSDSEKFASIINDVALNSGKRLIISKGQGDLPDNNSSDILYRFEK